MPPFLVNEKNAHTDFANYVRSFEIYARAYKIEGQQMMKDSFLVNAGKQLMEIYFLLPESIVEPTNVATATPYDDCIALLKAYFKKKTSRTYEKYLLRQIKQAESEEFQTFLKRIREQVKACEFLSQARIDEEIIDQIVFGTASDKLRMEVLKSDMTLTQIIDKALSMEGVSAQMKVFRETPSSVNRVASFRSNVQTNEERSVLWDYI